MQPEMPHASLSRYVFIFIYMFLGVPRSSPDSVIYFSSGRARELAPCGLSTVLADFFETEICSLSLFISYFSFFFFFLLLFFSYFVTRRGVDCSVSG